MISPIDLGPYLKTGQRELGDVRNALEGAITHLNDCIVRRSLSPGDDTTVADAARSLQDYSVRELVKFKDDVPDVLSLARLASLLRHISQTCSLLEVADDQRKGNLSARESSQFNGLDALIKSAYQPIQAVAGSQLTFQPEAIVGIFFENQFLARPQRPVPYVIIPDFLRQSPWLWNGVVHEVGHHVYRQFGFLRRELDVVIAHALAVSTLQYEVQRLWFNWLEESFCDIYGVLLLGEAYICSQFALYFYDRLPITEALGKDPTSSTPAEQDAMQLAVQRNLIRDPSGRHPVPAIRGLMAIAVLEKLRGVSVQADSLAFHWRTKVVETLKTNGWKIEDPHGAATVAGPAELPFSEVEQGMRAVVDTILDTSLYSFGCNKALSALVAFGQDEDLRTALMEALSTQKLQPGDAIGKVHAHLASLPAISNVVTPIPDQCIMRCWIAAQYMNWRAEMQ